MVTFRIIFMFLNVVAKLLKKSLIDVEISFK